MRGSLAKKFKKRVLSDMYGEDLGKDQKDLIVRTPKFKAIYRRAKKNYVLFGTRQHPIFKTSRRQQRIHNTQSNESITA